MMEPWQARELMETLAQIDALEFQQKWELGPELAGRSCHRHLYACHITACGTVFPCTGVTIAIGHVPEEPLSAILSKSEVLENLRAYKEKVKEPCGTCTQSNACYGCRGAAYQMTGDYMAGDAHCWKAVGVTIHSLPVDVAGLIPHGPRMQAIDQLVEIGEHEVETRVVVPATSAMVGKGGALEEAFYVEMIAQSLAASIEFQNVRRHAPRKGMLLSVRNLAVHEVARAGDALVIRIRKVLMNDPVSQTIGILLVGYIGSATHNWRWALALALIGVPVAIRMFFIREPEKGANESSHILKAAGMDIETEQENAPKVLLGSAVTRLLRIRSLYYELVAVAILGFAGVGIPLFGSLYFQRHWH